MDRDLTIEISIARQILSVKNGGELLCEYPVSTARNGPGEQQDSECTPRGRHEIAEKIGGGCDIDCVFVGRQPTGEFYSPQSRQDNPGRDWILTRILWLRGSEPGLNQGNGVDSYNRYIYIHGSPDDVQMGQPGSRGCIRMRNRDAIDLFDQVTVGTPVIISED